MAFENKGAMAATIVVAASDSLNKNAANYICDGTADNVEIQAAINALPAGGGKVLLLDGTYNIASAISLKSNIHFRGSGFATILRLAAAANVNVLLANAKTNIIISDMKIDGNKANQGAGTGRCIDLVSVSNAIVKDIWATAGYQHNITLGSAGACHDIIITKIITDSSNGSGIICSNECYNITISDVIATGNTQTGVYLSNCDYSSLKDILAYSNTAYGVDIFDSDYVTASNLICHLNQDGVHCEDSTYCTIQANSSSNSRDGLGLYRTSKDCAHIIVSGVFDNNTHYGINIRPNCARILVCNASASNNTAYGIYLEDADYCRFTNVVCKDNPNPYAGIIIKGTTNGKGIHNAIINCEFSKGEYTILLSTYADYTIIKGNDCLDNTRSGLSVVGEHNTYDQSLKSTALDLSGAAVDIATFHATCPCALAGYTIIYTEASSADAGVDVRVGRYQDGVALDDDYFDISTSEVSKNLGYSKHFVTADLTNKVIAAGDTVTVGTAGGKAGTGEVMIILHIVEMAK